MVDDFNVEPGKGSEVGGDFEVKPIERQAFNDQKFQPSTPPAKPEQEKGPRTARFD